MTLPFPTDARTFLLTFRGVRGTITAFVAVVLQAHSFAPMKRFAHYANELNEGDR